MKERFIQNIPDVVPDLDDAIQQQEIEELHSKLKMLVGANQHRKQELYEKYGIVLNPDNELSARLNLLIEMFIGILSPERLNFEIQWQKLIESSLEQGYAEYLEARRRQNGVRDLHLPGGRVHKVEKED